MGKKPPAILLEASEEEAKRLLAALKKARESLKSRVRPGEPVIPGEPAIKRRACSLLERYY
jgi:sugar-specific transcriptional regulator TrmB